MGNKSIILRILIKGHVNLRQRFEDLKMVTFKFHRSKETAAMPY